MDQAIQADMNVRPVGCVPIAAWAEATRSNRGHEFCTTKSGRTEHFSASTPTTAHAYTNVSLINKRLLEGKFVGRAAFHRQGIEHIFERRICSRASTKWDEASPMDLLVHEQDLPPFIDCWLRPDLPSVSSNPAYRFMHTIARIWSRTLVPRRRGTGLWAALEPELG